MLLVVGAGVLVAVSGTMLVVVWLGVRRIRSVLRSGTRTPAAVVQADADSGRHLGARPTVRYLVEGRLHEAALVNANRPAEVGSELEVVVRADRPFEPVLADTAAGGPLAGVAAMTAIACVLLIWAVLAL